jgi:hypothetical protein
VLNRHMQIQDGEGPDQPGVHGDGRAVSELRRVYEERAAAGGGDGDSGVADDGVDERDSAGIEAVREGDGAAEAGAELNASNDVVRAEQIMPITRKWNIARAAGGGARRFRWASASG